MISFADDPDGEGFAVKHGFTVVTRAPSLQLRLASCPRPRTAPEGLTLGVRSAEQPDLAHGVWETACEAFADIHTTATPRCSLEHMRSS